MTPIGSTSSNIRRAIEFMVDPSFCNLGAPSGRSRSVGRLRTAKLIAQRSRIAAWGTARNVPLGSDRDAAQPALWDAYRGEPSVALGGELDDCLGERGWSGAVGQVSLFRKDCVGCVGDSRKELVA